MGWTSVALLAVAVLVLVGAEWPRLSRRVGVEAQRRRARERQKAGMKLIRTETDEFAASVQRDLERLPTIDERDRRR